MHFPYSSRALWYILLITYSCNLLTCNLDRLPDFTQMEALGNPVGGQIFHNIMSQHFQLQLIKSNDSLAPSPNMQLHKTCLHLTPPPAWVDGYAVVTISDVAWLAGKKEKTRPEISGAEKYDLRALESSLVAFARGILVGQRGGCWGRWAPKQKNWCWSHGSLFLRDYFRTSSNDKHRFTMTMEAIMFYILDMFGEGQWKSSRSF